MASNDLDASSDRDIADFDVYGRRPGGGVQEPHARRGDPGVAREWPLGPHTGKGPKGYRRADPAILEDVHERLTRHGHIDATAMEVRVEGGEVTLIGAVDDRRTKRLAEEIAESVTGVTDVHNRLQIRT